MDYLLTPGPLVMCNVTTSKLRTWCQHCRDISEKQTFGISCHLLNVTRWLHGYSELTLQKYRIGSAEVPEISPGDNNERTWIDVSPRRRLQSIFSDEIERFTQCPEGEWAKVDISHEGIILSYSYYEKYLYLHSVFLINKLRSLFKAQQLLRQPYLLSTFRFSSFYIVFVLFTVLIS